MCWLALYVFAFLDRVLIAVCICMTKITFSFSNAYISVSQFVNTEILSLRMKKWHGQWACWYRGVRIILRRENTRTRHPGRRLYMMRHLPQPPESILVLCVRARLYCTPRMAMKVRKPCFDACYEGGGAQPFPPCKIIGLRRHVSSPQQQKLIWRKVGKKKRL